MNGLWPARCVIMNIWRTIIGKCGQSSTAVPHGTIRHAANEGTGVLTATYLFLAINNSVLSARVMSHLLTDQPITYHVTWLSALSFYFFCGLPKIFFCHGGGGVEVLLWVVTPRRPVVSYRFERTYCFHLQGLNLVSLLFKSPLTLNMVLGFPLSAKQS
jgi:hypothetical protein